MDEMRIDLKTMKKGNDQKLGVLLEVMSKQQEAIEALTKTVAELRNNIATTASE